MVHDRARASPPGRRPRFTCSTDPAKVAVPSGCVVIVEGLLLGAVRVVNAAGEAANAESVRVQLGEIADDGRYFDVWVVADDLADLESRGKLKLAPAFDWGGSESTPKARIAYVVPRKKQEPTG